MKYLIAIYAILILLISMKSQAFSIDSRVGKSPQGHYFQEMTLLCEANEGALCYAVCKDTLMCLEPEPLCLNCAGTSNDLLRVIFSKLSWYFEFEPMPLSLEQTAAFLGQKNYVILGSDSIYNFYRPHDASDIREQFSSLCPVGTKNAHLAVELNNRGEPTTLKYAFCQMSATETFVFPVYQKQQNQTPLQMRKN